MYTRTYTCARASSESRSICVSASSGEGTAAGSAFCYY